jgi:transcriptional regulator with XRE-family HTH domain
MENNQILDIVLEKMRRTLLMCEAQDHQIIPDICIELNTVISILRNFADSQSVETSIRLLETALDLLDHENTSVERIAADFECNRTGMKGRPVIKIPLEILEFYISCGFSQNDIAALLGVSKRTLNRRLSEMGISMSSKFSNISDEELDLEIQKIIHNFPDIGYRSVRSHLCVRGFAVQKSRVLEAMRRVDMEGILRRKLFLKPIFRRQYHVRGPLSLWHIDGYHKLIRYNFNIFVKLPL